MSLNVLMVRGVSLVLSEHTFVQEEEEGGRVHKDSQDVLILISAARVKTHGHTANSRWRRTYS